MSGICAHEPDFAGAWAEQQASTEFLVVLDSDTIFLDEPELSDEVDVFVRPVDDSKGSTTTGLAYPFLVPFLRLV